MNAAESRMLGEIKGILETVRDSHGRQLSSLFTKCEEIRTQLATMNGVVKTHETRIGRIEGIVLKAVVIALILAFGGATGVTAIKEFLLK